MPVNTAILQKDTSASKNIPYQALVDNHTVLTEAGEYIQTIKLQGTSFESKDDDELTNYHNRLNVLYRTMADPQIALYSHIVRRRENTYPEGDFEEGSFAWLLDREYKETLLKDVLMVNELYLSIIYKPTSAIANGFFKKTVEEVTSRKKPNFSSKIKGATLNFLGFDTESIIAGLQEEKENSLDFLNKTTEEVMAALDIYEPELLSTYDYTNPTGQKIKRSSQLEFYAFLINGEWQPMPLPSGAIKDTLATSRSFFGVDSFELWTPEGKDIYGAVLGIKEPTSETYTGFINQVLTLPFSYVITQSFAFQYKETAKNRIKLQANRLATSEDDGVSQQEALLDALDDVTSNIFVFGDFHFNMVIYGNSLEDVNDNISIARAALGDSGLIITREDLVNEAAFWAQLPGQTKLRPRTFMVSSKNFAAFSPFHNFPQGSLNNNHWGECVAMFNTNSGSPFYFSFHASDPSAEGGGSLKDVGHTTIIGPSGSGKTVFQTFTATMAQKFKPTIVTLSKDFDSQLSIQASNGVYFPIRLGERTGFNPFQAEPTQENRSFTYELAKVLLRHPQRDYTPLEEEELEISLNMLWDLPEQHRVLRNLKQSLKTNDPEGLHKRLGKWIEDGQYSWIFDNPKDTLHAFLRSSTNIGFDITSYLDVNDIRTPINMYLFHQINKLMDGRRFILSIAEFWKLLSDPAMQGFVQDQLKTQRKKNGMTVLDSQSPSDALGSLISRTLIEQTATKILFPNADADPDEYMDGLNLSEREFRLIKTDIPIGSRQFLIKQGKHSVVAELNLKGFPFYLDILSSRTANLEIAAAIQKKVGTNPADWLPLFKQQREAMNYSH